MSAFVYKAARATGEVIEGEMQAASKGELAAHLSDSGLIMIRAEQQSGAPMASLFRAGMRGGRRVPPKVLAVATRSLATLLESGVELERALEIAASLSDHPQLRRILEDVLESVRGGRSLADALDAHAHAFPPSYVSMVRAGEASAALDIVFDRVAAFLERSNAAREQVRSALVYPVILLVMSVVSIMVLVMFVLPAFEPLFRDAGRELPFLTRVVLASSDGVAAYGWVAAAALLLSWYAGRRHLEDPAARRAFDAWLLRVPLAGNLMVRLDISNFFRTLGTLLQNGVAALAAINIATATLTNAALAHAIEGAGARIRSGSSVSEALSKVAILPPLAARLVGIGDETGRLEEMLLRTADIYEVEARRTIDRLLAILLPALTALLGLFIALIIGAVFLAIVSVNELAV